MTETDEHDPVSWDFMIGQKQSMVLDLWMATGRDSREFEPFVAEHGWPLVWSLLLGEQRDGPVCWKSIDVSSEPDWCVLREGHIGPCYGRDDVAAPVFLPKPRLGGAGEGES